MKQLSQSMLEKWDFFFQREGTLQAKTWKMRSPWLAFLLPTDVLALPCLFRVVLYWPPFYIGLWLGRLHLLIYFIVSTFLFCCVHSPIGTPVPKLLFSEQPKLNFSERVVSLETCRHLQWENWIQILLHPHPPAKIIIENVVIAHFVKPVQK